MVQIIRPWSLAACLLLLQSATASYFIMTQCNCGENGFGYVRSYVTSFQLPSGQEASVEGNEACQEAGRPDSCAAWQLLEGCTNSGICGVGEVCYNQEAFQSDKFKINGNEYEKNSFTNTYYGDGAGRCDGLCSNWGMPRPQNPQDYRWEISGFPQPVACS